MIGPSRQLAGNVITLPSPGRRPVPRLIVMLTVFGLACAAVWALMRAAETRREERSVVQERERKTGVAQATMQAEAAISNERRNTNLRNALNYLQQSRQVLSQVDIALDGTGFDVQRTRIKRSISLTELARKQIQQALDVQDVTAGPADQIHRGETQ